MSGPDLDRRIGRFAPAAPRVAAAADALGALGVRCCCAAIGDAPLGPAPDLADPTLREALDAAVAGRRGWGWDATPPDLVALRRDGAPLDAPTPAIRSAGRGAWRVLAEDGGLDAARVSFLPGLGDAEGPRVTLDLAPGDLRGLLDAIVGPVPRLVWRLSGPPAGPFSLSFTEIEGRRGA
jgi:hypothetical protein